MKDSPFQFDKGFFLELRSYKNNSRPRWITGTGNQNKKEIIDLVKYFNSNYHVLHVVQSNKSSVYSTYSGINNLLNLIIPIVQDEGPQIIQKYKDVLENVCPHLIGANTNPESPLNAHAVTYAIIRRISRESLHTTKYIDGISRFILDAHHHCNSLKKLCLMIDNFDLLDRPSLRIFYRLQMLLTQNDDIKVISICLGEPLLEVTDKSKNTDKIRNSLAISRKKLFEKLVHDLNPHRISLGYYDQQVLADPIEEMPFGYDYVLKVGENLVEQNYDFAYLIAECGLKYSDDNEVKADLYRLIGLVEANVGEHQKAKASIKKAIHFSESKLLKAHLYYLLGLLCVKRDYEYSEANVNFNKGLEMLEHSQDKNRDFEEAWLINGKALVGSLMVKTAPEIEKNRKLTDVIKNELDALSLVKNGKGPHYTYLRYNLLANIAFLLEIIGDNTQAIKFWDRAFGLYLDTSRGQRFEPVYLYRIGIIYWKNEEINLAVTSLDRALEAASALKDKFLEERIIFALSYIQFYSGEVEKAREHFKVGFEISWDLREIKTCVIYLQGLFQSSKKLKDIEQMNAIEDLTTEIKLCFPHIEFPVSLEESILPPSPKLPAYLPSIDLEISPKVDLNRYLVSQK